MTIVVQRQVNLPDWNDDVSRTVYLKDIAFPVFSICFLNSEIISLSYSIVA